jgi:hypothetical protein
LFSVRGMCPSHPWVPVGCACPASEGRGPDGLQIGWVRHNCPFSLRIYSSSARGNAEKAGGNHAEGLPRIYRRSAGLLVTIVTENGEHGWISRMLPAIGVRHLKAMPAADDPGVAGLLIPGYLPFALKPFGAGLSKQFKASGTATSGPGDSRGSGLLL